MKQMLLIILLVLFNNLGAADKYSLNPDIDKPVISVLQSNLNSTLAEISFPGFTAEDTVREGIKFQFLTMKDFGTNLVEGLPQLPGTVRLVGIDNRGDYKVIPTDVEYVEYDNFYVFPAQPQPTREGQDLPWTMNKQLYASDTWYPENMVANEEPAILRDYRVLPVEIYPIQFNPAQRKIRVAKKITFRVEQSGTAGPNEKQYEKLSESPTFQPLYRDFIINYNQIGESRTPGINGLPDMIIITHDAYYDEVMPFARWKEQKGIATQVVRTSEIAANPTANQIKDFILNEYNTATDKPDYLLIVGDVTGPNAVPWFSAAGSMTDLTYYLLEGGDLLPDISGARISIGNTTEANTVFTKLIRYEKEPYLTDPNWFHSGLVINSNDFQDPIAGVWAYNHMTAYGYNPVVRLGDDIGNATVANISQAVNAGVSYIFYIGHGAPTYWVTSGFSTSNIPNLTNGEMQPVISSVACNNADLDEPNDVFAEVWLKNNLDKGSVGIMAFTESCAVYETDTLARGMLRAILSDTITAFGNIIDYGRLHMIQSFPSSYNEPLYQSILIGEPELQVWTRTPEPLAVNMPSAAFFNIPFNVQVSDGQNPVEGAMVCYWDSLGNYARVYTDANGNALVDHAAVSPVTGTITVTYHNKIPFQSVIEILPPAGPYVMAQNLIATDTLGNNNGVIESGEHFFFQLTLENIGVDPADNVSVTVSTSDTALTLMQNTASFGTITAGGSMTAGDFEAEVSPGCPHMHSIPVQIEISADGGHLWQQQRFIQVHQGARISLSADTLTFPATFLTFTSELSLAVENTGPDTLWMQDITSSNPHFSVFPVQFSVAPGKAENITVGFTPDSVQTYPGTITLFNSDPTSFVKTFYVTGNGIYAPSIKVPDSIPVSAQASDSLTRNFYIENNGFGDLYFTAQVSGYNPNGAPMEGTGGADTFGHIWIDSDEPSGPAFNWIDISATGTEIALTGNNSISDKQTIGFDFSFYGLEYNDLRVCSNGWISFSTFSVAYNNVSLPNNLAPRTLIAPLWDDLLMNQDSKVYTENQGNKFIIMFDNFYRVTGEGPYDFEVVLYDNNNILLQYLTLDSLVHDYTVGIQNHDATDGLTIAFNESYLKDSLAVLISKHSWLTIEPTAATIPAQGNLEVMMTIRTSNFPLGEFYAGIQIESNDPAAPIVIIPVHLTVGLTGIEDSWVGLPKTLQLDQNYPNPFNPTTSISYALPSLQRVEIIVYNLLGQKVRTLVNAVQNAGTHRIEWNGTNDLGNTVGSGIYLYQLKTEEKTLVRKMILMK